MSAWLARWWPLVVGGTSLASLFGTAVLSLGYVAATPAAQIRANVVAIAAVNQRTDTIVARADSVATRVEDLTEAVHAQRDSILRLLEPLYLALCLDKTPRDLALLRARCPVGIRP